MEERKQAEELLRESEERYRRQFEEAIDAILVADAETGIIIDCNRAASELVGREKSELVGKHQRILHPPEEIEGEFSRTFKQHLEEKEGQVLEDRVITKNGEIKDVAIKANVFELGNKRIIQGTFRDITEQKKAEEALRQSVENYRELLNGMNDTAWVIGFDGKFIDVNDAAVKVLGYSREELLSMGPPDIDNTLTAEQIRDLIKQMPTDEIQVFETTHTTKDGKAIPVEISSSLVTYHGKRAILSIARNITERKKMEERLLESGERLRNLYENIPDSLCVIVGREGHLLEYNKAFKKRYGYTDEELKDKKFLDFVHPDDRAMILEKYRTRYPEEELPLVFEVREINKKGEVLPTEVSVGTYKKKGRVIGIELQHRDIAERKEMEKKLQEYAEHLEEMVEERTKELKESQERLLKAERLAAIGELATMVGHDLRNPLTSIQNACYYLKMKLGASKDEKIEKMFEIIGREINYTNKIINDLLDFSKVKKPELKKVDLISSIQDAIAQLKFPENIILTTKFSEVPAIEADPDQLRRVFQNMALNGTQAMPKGGKLTVSTRKNGDFVEATFTDTGVGISEENMDKLFTPLFTTKAQGVGLGLAICKNLVEVHNGRIEVKSKVGEGSTFTVKLPIHQNKGGGEQT